MGHPNYIVRSISLRSKQHFYITEAKKADSNLNVKCSLSSESRSDLEWWVFNLEKSNGKDFFPKNLDIKIFSDASLSGWGAVFNGVATRGPWTTAQADLHINHLELTAAIYALQSFVGEAQGHSVQIYLDNSTAVCYVNKGGGTRSSDLTKIAKWLAEFCEHQNLTIKAVHLPGVMNVEADRESRSECDASDWLLNRAVFNS
jgi:ribonuclease HI